MPIVSAICIGTPQPFNGAELSAIAKRPVEGRVTIREFGIEGDMVADTKHHGGPEMAVHQYPRDHYSDWNAWLGGHDLLAGDAAFGENLVVDGLAEDDVFIGDRFRLGRAVLEISQPRQPCWKIEHRFNRKGMVARIVKQHNCGWYYRVIEEGEAEAGETLDRIEQGNARWPVSKTFAKFYDPGERANEGELRELASLKGLCAEWRAKARKTLES